MRHPVSTPRSFEQNWRAALAMFPDRRLLAEGVIQLGDDPMALRYASSLQDFAQGKAGAIGQQLHGRTPGGAVFLTPQA